MTESRANRKRKNQLGHVYCYSYFFEINSMFIDIIIRQEFPSSCFTSLEAWSFIFSLIGLISPTIKADSRGTFRYFNYALHKFRCCYRLMTKSLVLGRFNCKLRFLRYQRKPWRHFQKRHFFNHSKSHFISTNESPE